MVTILTMVNRHGDMVTMVNNGHHGDMVTIVTMVNRHGDLVTMVNHMVIW